MAMNIGRWVDGEWVPIGKTAAVRPAELIPAPKGAVDEGYDRINLDAPGGLGGTVLPGAVPNQSINRSAEEVDYGSLTPASELYDYFRGVVGQNAPTIRDPYLAANEYAAGGYGATTGLGDDYFTRERDRVKNDLRDEFFGKGGALDQTRGQEAFGGRLKSGVALNQIQQTVTDPYAKAITGVETESMQAQAREKARVDEFNATQYNQYRTTLANLRGLDSQNQLTADSARATLKVNLDDLAYKMATGAGEQEYKIWSAAIEDAHWQIDNDLEERKFQWEVASAPVVEHKITNEEKDRSSGSFDTPEDFVNTFGNHFNNKDRPADFPDKAQNGSIYRDQFGQTWKYNKPGDRGNGWWDLIE